MGGVDVVGRPLKEAEAMLSAANLSWRVEMTRPARNFFPLDETRLYVLRQTEGPDGSLVLIAASAIKSNEGFNN